MHPNPTPQAPTNYAEFWTASSVSSSATRLDSSQSASSIHNNLPTTSTPRPTAETFPHFPRSFGSDSTNKTLFSSFGNFTTSDDFTMGFYPITPQSPTKRKKVSEPNSPSKHERKRQKSINENLPVTEKLDKVIDALEEVSWNLGDLMFYLFAHRDVHRSKRHATIVQRYLSGKSARNISDVLDAWLTSPDDAGYDQEGTMYQTAIPYNDIPHARSCLTSFAAQIVKTKLLKEAKAAVKISGGMHAPTEHKTQSEDSTGKFADLATSLMHNMKSILKTNQGLFYDYVLALATPEPIRRSGVVKERRNRPPELTAILSATAYPARLASRPLAKYKRFR
ncbi:hypothetical protein FB451DRAFT_1411824 [Mycena latifolia]|nr:hypothetical protein FB451DRAFT_1411824 [Mycena latifolia]